MKVNPTHKLLDRVFEISIVLKGLNGVLEIVGGVALLFINPDQIRAFLAAITAHAVHAHPHSPIWHWFQHLADALDTRATVFAAIYLLLHGVIKVVLVWALLKEQMWAYPWMIVALVVFIAYQCYDLVVHFTWGMVALTVFDVFIVALTFREWQLHKARRAAAPAAAGSETAPVEN